MLPFLISGIIPLRWRRPLSSTGLLERSSTSMQESLFSINCVVRRWAKSLQKKDCFRALQSFYTRLSANPQEKSATTNAHYVINKPRPMTDIGIETAMKNNPDPGITQCILDSISGLRQQSLASFTWRQTIFAYPFSATPSRTSFLRL